MAEGDASRFRADPCARSSSGALCAAVLADCAVVPQPLTPEDTALRIVADRARPEANLT